MIPTPAYRITVFVPTANANDIQMALERTKVLKLGKYENVTWTSSEGKERFTPLEGATPKIGEIGIAEDLGSRQIIFAIPQDNAKLKEVLDAISSAHPWESPAIFVDETVIYLPG